MVLDTSWLIAILCDEREAPAKTASPVVRAQQYGPGD
jgi:hypothetical protein